MDWDAADEMHDIRQDERQEKPMSDAAQIIAAHDLEYSAFNRRFRCGCGVEFSDLAKRFVRPEWAAHVLAVLSETHAVVELPEATVSGGDDVAYTWGTIASPSAVREAFQMTALAPHEAREYGAELIAAARVAEGGAA